MAGRRADKQTHNVPDDDNDDDDENEEKREKLDRELNPLPTNVTAQPKLAPQSAM